MFRWIIGSSLQFRFIVMAGAAALVLFGTFQLQKMPVDVFPEFAAPTVEVQTEAIGLSAKEVEGLVTVNLEELLSGVPWVTSIRSESITGLSSIVLTFNRGTDLIKARQMVQERLALSIFLPNVAQPPVILQSVSATRRFMMVSLSSDEVEATDLSMLARWTIKPKLVGVPGVANVAIWGQRLRQLQVQIDPDRLRDARLMQDDIIAATGDALWVSPLTFLKGSTPGTGGFIDNANQRLGVHHSMPIASPEDMAQVAVAPQHLLLTGKQMALGDVAEVTYSHPPLIGDAIVNGGKGLLLVVEKFPSANTLEVTRGVEQALAELQRGLPGVQIDANVYRLASYVEDSIFNMTQAMVVGLILVVLIVGALLFNWRSALISLVSIPLSLFAAVIALQLTGMTLNTMVLAGLLVALGVVIDDAVVHAEKLMDRIRERKEDGGSSIMKIIFETTMETRGIAMYAALIVLLAIIPILFLGGVSGAFFQPLALAYVLAVVASMVVGLTVTPALSLVLLAGRARGAGSESPIAVWIRDRYEAGLRRAMKTPAKVFVAAAVVVVVGIGLWPFLGQSLLPALKENDLLVNWATPPGTSHEETVRITARVSRELQTLPGVRSVAAHIGRAVTGDQIVDVNAGQIWVGLDRDADYDEMAVRIRETVDGYVGVDRSVQSYLRDTVSEVLTGASNAIVVRIFGQKRDVLLHQAEEVKLALADTDGLVDLRVEGQIEEPQILVQVDIEAAAKANVKPGEVRRSAATVFSGLTVGFLFEESKIFDVVVWSQPEARNSLTSLKDVWVEKSDRHRVRLGDVADARIQSTPTVIRHDANAPFIDVVANVEGRDLGSVSRDVKSRLETVAFPLEYHPVFLGEIVERQNAQQRLLGLAIAALIGIFLLLQACFRGWRLALIAFLALPASAAGGVFAVLLSGGVVSLGSIVGFFAVLGIAARNGILLITHYQRLEGQDGVPFGLDLVIRGARERLSSILASSVAIIAALLPIIVLGQIAGLEIAQPTAIVIIGGVVASTLVTLLVVPALYLAFGAGADRQPDLGLAEI